MPRQDGVSRPAYLLNSGRTTTIQCTRSSGPGGASAHFQEGTAARRLTTTISPHRGQRRQFPRFFVAPQHREKSNHSIQHTNQETRYQYPCLQRKMLPSVVI